MDGFYCFGWIPIQGHMLFCPPQTMSLGGGNSTCSLVMCFHDRQWLHVGHQWGMMMMMRNKLFVVGEDAWTEWTEILQSKINFVCVKPLVKCPFCRCKEKDDFVVMCEGGKLSVCCPSQEELAVTRSIEN